MSRTRRDALPSRLRPGWSIGALILLFLPLCVSLVLRLQPANAVISTVPLGVSPGQPVVDPYSGHTFVPNYLDTDVEVLNSSTGVILRTLTVGSNGGAHPGAVRVDGEDHRLFVASDDGRLSTFDTVSGKPLQVATLGGSVQYLTLDQQRRLLFDANPDTGTLSVVDAVRGTRLHTASLGFSPQALAVDGRTDRIFVVSLDDHAIRVLDAASGTSLRVSRLNIQPQAMLVDVPLGLVFVTGVDDAGLAVLDARSGALLHTMTFGKRQITPGYALRLAVDDSTGHLFVARGTEVGMLDAHSLRLLHRTEIGSAVTALAVDAQAHSCLAVAQGGLEGSRHLTGMGKVVVLDGGSGAVRRTITVGVGPHAIGVDTDRRRALVIDTNLNPDGSFVHLPRPDTTWVQRLPWIGSALPGLNQAQMPADGHGSVTVLDLSRL